MASLNPGSRADAQPGHGRADPVDAWPGPEEVSGYLGWHRHAGPAQHRSAGEPVGPGRNERRCQDRKGPQRHRRRVGV